RAAYDRLLKFERERFRRRLKGTASYLVRNIVSDAIAVVGLAIVLGGGYTLFAYISKTPIEAAKLAEVTARGPAKTGARTDTPFVLSAIASAANDGRAPAAAKGSAIPSSAGPNTDVAKPNDALDVPIRQADLRSAADRPDRTGMRPLDQDAGHAADIRFS